MPKRTTRKKLRSKLEDRVKADLVASLGRKVKYEPDTFTYTVPATTKKYTPDFRIRENVYIEAKGIWDRLDREKILLMKEQHPEVTIYMLFSNANNKIYKGSKTTYGMWCDTHGIPWACYRTHGIPTSWLHTIH